MRTSDDGELGEKPVDTGYIWVVLVMAYPHFRKLERRWGGHSPGWDDKLFLAASGCSRERAVKVIETSGSSRRRS